MNRLPHKIPSGQVNSKCVSLISVHCQISEGFYKISDKFSSSPKASYTFFFGISTTIFYMKFLSRILLGYKKC